MMKVSIVIDCVSFVLLLISEVLHCNSNTKINKFITIILAQRQVMPFTKHVYTPAYFVFAPPNVAILLLGGFTSTQSPHMKGGL